MYCVKKVDHCRIKMLAQGLRPYCALHSSKLRKAMPVKVDFNV